MHGQLDAHSVPAAVPDMYYLTIPINQPTIYVNFSVGIDLFSLTSRRLDRFLS